MKKICIIIPYFGQLPKNIITFLLSCKKNKFINWIIFTNDKRIYKLNNICNNVKFIKSNMKQMRERLIKVTGIKDIKLNAPYKLCDYRPLYGKMFSDYLEGYDYWGYSDLDVVYGDLLKYISYGIRHDYEKIGKLGHFTLIHNDHNANNRYKLPIYKNGHKIYLFDNIISRTNKCLAFDEWPGIDAIYKQYNIKTYCNPYLVNEIIFTNLDLETRDKSLYKFKWQCYTWQNGHAIFYYINNHKIMSKEFGYFHFQKRQVFKHFIYNVNTRNFSITTLGYNNMNYVNPQNIKKYMRINKSSLFKRLRYKLHWYMGTDQFATRMHIGNIRLPIKYILNCISKNDFRVFKL